MRGIKSRRFKTGKTSSLIFSFLLLGFDGVNSNFLVVFFERGEIFTRLGELALLHSLADVLHAVRTRKHSHENSPSEQRHALSTAGRTCCPDGPKR